MVLTTTDISRFSTLSIKWGRECNAHDPLPLSHPQITHLQAPSGPEYPKNREMEGFGHAVPAPWLSFSASWTWIGSCAPYASIHVQWMAPPSPHRPWQAHVCAQFHCFSKKNMTDKWFELTVLHCLKVHANSYLSIKKSSLNSSWLLRTSAWKCDPNHTVPCFVCMT